MTKRIPPPAYLSRLLNRNQDEIGDASLSEALLQGDSNAVGFVPDENQPSVREVDPLRSPATIKSDRRHRRPSNQVSFHFCYSYIRKRRSYVLPISICLVLLLIYVIYMSDVLANVTEFFWSAKTGHLLLRRENARL